VGWAGGAVDGQSANGPPLIWLGGTIGWLANQGIGQKLGVMFPASAISSNPQYQTVPGGSSVTFPWNIRTTVSGIVDGMSTTFLLGENTLVGYSVAGANPLPNTETNWACPHPNFTSFMASDNVCDGGGQPGVGNGNCFSALLGPVTNASTGVQTDGPDWEYSSHPGTYENVGYGQNLTNKGFFPYVSSGHPGGHNVVMCDGSVHYIRNTMSGLVFSKLITPAGSKLPLATPTVAPNGLRQLPVNQDEINTQ
jgi:prepilin-type processing-associated H-X9-DG protein